MGLINDDEVSFGVDFEESEVVLEWVVAVCDPHNRSICFVPYA